MPAQHRRRSEWKGDIEKRADRAPALGVHAWPDTLVHRLLPKYNEMAMVISLCTNASIRGSCLHLVQRPWAAGGLQGYTVYVDQLFEGAERSHFKFRRLLSLIRRKGSIEARPS